ncbi:MAG: superoxide dismutase [Burkholderiales bacterium]
MKTAEVTPRAQFALPSLPYGLDALAPHISKETLQFHHGKHHRAYVAKLNELVQGTEFDGQPLEAIVRGASGAIYNNAAQAWNHDFYWHCMKPGGGGKPGGALAGRLEQTFGGADAFLAQFRKSALGKFGSGWTWLVRTGDGRLAIQNTDDAGNPLREGAKPVLVCDVWEHAYYIDYRNDRGKYVDAFLGRVDWSFVERNLAS